MIFNEENEEPRKHGISLLLGSVPPGAGSIASDEKTMGPGNELRGVISEYGV